MTARRRLLRWLPALPIIGPLAIKAGTMAQAPAVQKAAAVPELLFKHGEASSPYWIRVGGGLWRLDLWLPPNVLYRYSEQIGNTVRWSGSTAERFGVASNAAGQRIASELWTVIEPLARMAA